MAFAENLDLFFGEFADDATLDGQAVRVIFDEPGGGQVYGEAGGAVNLEPQVQVATASVPADPYGKALVIATGRGAGSWTAREHLPDGTGLSLLLLTKAAA